MRKYDERVKGQKIVMTSEEAYWLKTAKTGDLEDKAAAGFWARAATTGYGLGGRPQPELRTDETRFIMPETGFVECGIQWGRVEVNPDGRTLLHKHNSVCLWYGIRGKGVFEVEDVDGKLHRYDFQAGDALDVSKTAHRAFNPYDEPFWYWYAVSSAQMPMPEDLDVAKRHYSMMVYLDENAWEVSEAPPRINRMVKASEIEKPYRKGFWEVKMDSSVVKERRIFHPDVGNTDLNYSLGTIDIQPKGSILFHKHNCWDAELVLSGGLLLEVEDNRFELKAWDAFQIPPMAKHRYSNPHDEPVKILYSTSHPLSYLPEDEAHARLQGSIMTIEEGGVS